jgi:hypothetical protein
MIMTPLTCGFTSRFWRQTRFSRPGAETMAGSRAVTCPACAGTYDKRSAHNCPAAPLTGNTPVPYPLIEIPHGGPGKCPYPTPSRSWCDRCDHAMAINERRILIFDHTEGAGPWPGTCSVARCQNMVLTEGICNEHYSEQLRGRRRGRRAS